MPTLLVVDDEPSILRLVSAAMLRRGWNVVVASTVASASAVVHHQSIDVVLCDVVMPGAGGPELARTVRAGGSRAPVVLMTGYSSSRLADEHLPRWWNPLPVLEKPFSPAQLVAVLEGALVRA